MSKFGVRFSGWGIKKIEVRVEKECVCYLILGFLFFFGYVGFCLWFVCWVLIFFVWVVGGVGCVFWVWVWDDVVSFFCVVWDLWYCFLFIKSSNVYYRNLYVV